MYRYPTRVAAPRLTPAETDQALQALSLAAQRLTAGQDSPYICDQLTEYVGVTRPRLESTCYVLMDWIKELLRGKRSLYEYNRTTSFDVRADVSLYEEMQEVRLAWIDWMIKELGNDIPESR